MVSLAAMPVPFLVYWFQFYYSRDGLATAREEYFQGVEASAAVVFLILAGVTALFFRFSRRVVRVALLFVTGLSMVVLSWLSYQGGPGYMAAFMLAAMVLVVLLAPALMDKGPDVIEDPLSLIEDTG